MTGPLKTGATGTLTFTVTGQHVIDFADDTMPAVLCTPWLVWFLEHAAREAVLAVLEPHESTVGVNVNVDHIAPTPVGQRVRCEAKVIRADHGLVSFRLRAWDEDELIAQGTHKMHVIEAARFGASVARKRKGP